MRSIKFILRNLLVVVATLLLFTNIVRATNSETVGSCKEVAEGLEEERKLLDNNVTAAADGAAPKVAGESGQENAGNADKSSSIAAKGNYLLAAQTQALIAKCEKACLLPIPKLDQAEKEYPASKAASEMKNYFNDDCHEKVGKWIPIYSTGAYGFTASQAMAKKARGSLLTKVAIGAAVVGGGLLVMDHINDKKDKKKEAKAAEEKRRVAEGIIKDADGNDIACFSEQNFMRLECNATMLSLCQGDKANLAGCKAFNSNYCASTGSGSNYCLYSDSKTYCSQSGSVIASSPACQWANARSAECKANPEQVSCLYGGSGESLTLVCANYPSDPLCAAHNSGRIVVQGGTSATTTASTSSGSTESGAATNSENGSTGADYGDGSSVSMSSVIGSGTGSSNADSAALAATTLASTDSMFTSSTSVSQQACANGLLQNCSN